MIGHQINSKLTDAAGVDNANLQWFNLYQKFLMRMATAQVAKDAIPISDTSHVAF
jgi:hypothetical protein